MASLNQADNTASASVLVLSAKTTLTISGESVQFHRNTFKGRRVVSVPVRVLAWAVNSYDRIIKLALEGENTTQLNSPDLDWAVGRSFFQGTHYTSFINFNFGQRNA